MNDALHKALSDVLLAAASGLAIVVGAYFRKLAKKVADKAARDELTTIALAAVRWAAQTLDDTANADKKQAVVDYIKKRIPSVNEEDLEKAIEAAVYQLNAGE